MQSCLRRSRYTISSLRLSVQLHLRNHHHQYSISSRCSFRDTSAHSDRGTKIRIRHVGKSQGRSPQIKIHHAGGELLFNEVEQKRFLEKIRKVLAAIHTSLEPKSVENVAGKDYFAELITDKEQWKNFEKTLKELLDVHTQSPLKDLKFQKRWSLVDSLKKESIKPEWFQHLTRTIKFAYIDQKLQEDTALTSSARSDLGDLRYPTEWYPGARCLQRHIHLHVGPTNSGKTYNALKRLEESKNGYYAGPLRLLAHEVYSRFNNRGIKCELVTGDDVRLSDEKVDMYCSTVEMVDINRSCSVGVIDEIQMIGSDDRGWAWTRALLGSRAAELHLCGEARVVPLIRELVASMGDTLHIHQYERLNPLKVMSQSLKGNLKNLRRGDCIVSFSVMNIHALKRQIELETGRRAAIVYGSLPPETRAQQATLFNDPDNDYDYLVASDAVGMGLNLSIKRVIFERTMRFNGVSREQLSVSQIKQIAGRAGRYRTANDDSKTVDAGKPSSKPSTKSVGLVSCLDDRDLASIATALKSEAPPIKAAGLLPVGELYERASLAWPRGLPFEYIMKRLHQIVSLNPRFNLCDVTDQLDIARVIDEVPGLSIADRLLICASPAQVRSRSGRDSNVVVALAKAIAAKRTVTICDIPEVPLEILDEPLSPDREYLEGLEVLHKTLNLYLWLHYRFASILTNKDMAVRAKELTEEKINACLVNYSANPKLAARLKAIRQASALVREQAGQEAGAMEENITMNPDATVEEVERRAREDAQQNEIDDFVNDDSVDHGLPSTHRPVLNDEWKKHAQEAEQILLPDRPGRVGEESAGTR